MSQAVSLGSGTRHYQEQAKYFELQAAFNAMLAASLVCLMLLGQPAAPALVIAAACTSFLGAVAGLVVAQLFWKLASAPDVVTPRHFSDSITIGSGTPTDKLSWKTCNVALARLFAQISSYTCLALIALTVVWSYPNEYVIYIARVVFVVFVTGYTYSVIVQKWW